MLIGFYFIGFYFILCDWFTSLYPSILSIQDESAAADKPNSRDPAALAHSGFTLAASAYSQDQLHTNGGLNYSFRGYGTIGNSLQNNGTSQTNGG